MRIKKEKSSNPSTGSKNVTTRVTEIRLRFFEEYGNPIPDNVLDDLCLDMQEWSDKKSSLRFKDFLTENRIQSKMFYDFLERHKGLQREYEFTLNKIASRREIGAISRRFDATSALRMMPRYDHEWTENEEKLAKIKRLSQQEGNNGQTIIAVLPEIPHSNLVPSCTSKLEEKSSDRNDNE